MSELEPLDRRKGDAGRGWRGLLCWLARRGEEFWDFIDKRDIDKHVVMACILAGTIRITEWSMRFIETHSDDAGADVGLKVGAVLLAWNIIATPAIKWYFERKNE